ncbi:uncharacterized protein DS421_12g362860 [Arachis hypogaea]|nr:uncharacterized protein DS421_12g362860 [Arachis hypogaea]
MSPHLPTDTVLTFAGQPDAPRSPALSLTLLSLFCAPFFRTGFAFSYFFKLLLIDDSTMLLFFFGSHG